MKRINIFTISAKSVALIKERLEKNQAAALLKERFKVEITDSKTALLDVAYTLAMASSDSPNYKRFMELLQIAVDAMVDSFIYD